MKILVVTSSYPRFRGDIAGRFVLEWVTHLEELGHELEVLTWRDSSSQAAAPSSADQPPADQPQPLDTDHKVVRVPYAPPGFDTLFYGAGTPENLRENPARALLAAPAALAMLGRVSLSIARFRPDLIAGHWLVPSGLIVRAVGRLTGIPTFVVGHSGGVHLLDRLLSPIGRALAGFVASGPTSVPSLPLAEKLAGLVGDGPAPYVLPMGFEPAAESDSRAESDSSRWGAGLRPAARSPASPRVSCGRSPKRSALADTHAVTRTGPRRDPGGPEATRPNRQDWLCMGRLVDIKGVDLAIEAFARADLPGQPTLHIAGDGPERADLERLAKRLDARVEFHGFVTGDKKERLWEQCGFALFTSKQLADGRHEGLPVSFLEACSRGLLPICAPIPGLGIYLADRTLQQVDPRSPDAWARRIEQVSGLGGEAREELSQRQQERVGELEWSKLISRWDDLLRRAHLF